MPTRCTVGGSKPTSSSRPRSRTWSSSRPSFARWATRPDRDTILATNTSALSVTEIAESSGVPDRVLGLHFFNPAPVMPLVEVVATTRHDTALSSGGDGSSRAWARRRSSARLAGFIVNRVNRPFTLEALRLLEAGEAGRADRRAVEAAGYPMGPFRLMDLVGIDVNLAVATALCAGFHEAPRFTPSPIQAQLVERGRLGRKTGVGFYRYEDGRRPASALLGRASRMPPVTLLPTRRSWSGSSSRSSTRPIAPSASSRHAVGHRSGAEARCPPSGRPVRARRQLGLRRVVDGLRELEQRYGERFSVAPSLWQIASI